MKGQTQVLGYLIIVVVVAGLISSAMLWGVPLIQKRKDAKRTDDVKNFFVLLAKTIEEASREGTKETLYLNVEGMFELYPINYTGAKSGEYNNSIVFKFLTKSPGIPVGTDWIPIETQNMKESPYAVSGLDTAYILMHKAKRTATDFEIEYRLRFRSVMDHLSDKVYKIILVGSDAKTLKRSVSQSVTIIPQRTYNQTINGITYIFTEVKIVF